MPFEPAGIIPELQAYPQWVTWILEYDPQRAAWTKRPYNPKTGRYASVDNPATWCSYEEAYEAYRMSYSSSWDGPTYSGLGLVLTEQDPLFGVDIDKCINQKTGEIAAAAIEWIEKLQSYTQVSPGGAGIRIFGIGKLPGTARRKGTFECYDAGRFLTMTGKLFPGA